MHRPVDPATELLRRRHTPASDTVKCRAAGLSSLHDPAPTVYVS